MNSANHPNHHHHHMSEMYHHPYGYGHRGPWGYRRPFGGFKRLFWFGLGVGAATWYIHGKERQRQAIQTVTPEAPAKPNGWSWADHRRRCGMREPELPVQKEGTSSILADPNALPINMKHKHPEEEMKILKEVAEGLWADKKAVTATAKDQTNEKVKEYALEKLDKLSVALDNLRNYLKHDLEEKVDKKLV